MSVQRWTADGYGAQQGEMMPDPEGPWMLAADHARIVAEMEQAHLAALAAARPRLYADGQEVWWKGRHAVVNFSHWSSSLGMYRYHLTFADELGYTSHASEATLTDTAPDAAAPRPHNADDPGYHSQRCLHCDHIRATHTLTAHGCIGHALPGRPGADCPCAEFIHDGGEG